MKMICAGTNDSADKSNRAITLINNEGGEMAARCIARWNGDVWEIVLDPDAANPVTLGGDPDIEVALVTAIVMLLQYQDRYFFALGCPDFRLADEDNNVLFWDEIHHAA